MRFISFGQMGTITERPQTQFFGSKIDCSYYKSPKETSHLLVFLVGKGEVSDCAGGNIQALYKYGFPKLVKQNLDFDFNILMIQPCGASYPVTFQKALLPWINEEYHPSKIILSGISLGAICLLDMLTCDQYGHIDGVVSLSGAPSASKGIDEALSRMRFVPGYAVHGTADNIVSYSKQKKFIEAYNFKNAGTPNVFVFDEIIGAGHTADVWNNAMSYGSPLHKWIITQFGPEPVGDTFNDGKEFVKKQVAEILDKL
jgi:predicted esterase